MLLVQFRHKAQFLVQELPRAESRALWAGEEVMPHRCGCLLCLTGSTGKASSEGFQLSDDRSTKSSEKF